LNYIKRIAKNRAFLIGLLIVGMILFPVFYNAIIIRPRIYYRIKYNVELSNKEELINKVENFNYTAYLNNYFELYEVYKRYIDIDFVNFLKSRIENDTYLHWELNYRHYLNYNFRAENHSELYLTYNNNSILDVKDYDNSSLILVEHYGWDEVAWYLNFTQIPFVYSENSTIMLEDMIFVKMRIDYGYYCGSLCGLWYFIDQYLLLDQNLDILLIFIPYSYMIVS
jgi:hypothetical protein